jgi:hypothetical protein
VNHQSHCLFGTAAVTRWFSLTVWATLHGIAFGGWETLVSNYTPYHDGRPWPRVPVIAYVESTSNLWVHPSAPKKFPTLQEVADEDSDFATVVMRLPDGLVFKTYNDRVLGPYLAAVYSGDFNSDGVPDFMALKPGTGCGIAGEYAVVVFAFSEKPAGYRFTRVRAWGPGPHDLVVDPVTRNFRFMHTILRTGTGTDERYHSFWVHRFFQWDGGKFEEDPKLPPVWIQYLHRPNHEPTKLLTPALKAKAWTEDSGFEATIEW